MTFRRVSLSAVLAILGACGDSAQTQVKEVTVPPVPKRTAAEAEDLRLMAAQVAAAEGCKRLAGRFRPLSTGHEDARVTGSLWIDACEATNDGTAIALELGGKGWRWVDRSTEKAGAEFQVRQYVRFALDAQLDAQVDIDYEPETHLFLGWLTPTTAPEIDVQVRGDIDVDEQGMWSDAVAALATSFMDSPAEQAETRIEAQATDAFRKRFSDGLTFAYDLCTGKTHAELGVVTDRELVQEEGADEPDVRARLHRDGLIITGPLEGDGREARVRVVPEDEAVRVQLTCIDQARTLASAFMEGRELPEVPALADAVVSDATVLRAPSTCPLTVVSRPVGATPASFHYSELSRADGKDEGVLRCEPKARQEHARGEPPG